MIEFKKGNMLEADAEALVNTVNCVGVMGKGIALQFKKAYPDNFKEYEKACRHNLVTPGKMFVRPSGALFGPKYIINFPTKDHWKSSSKMEYINEGLSDLVTVIERLGIKSVAIPPLGCGNGGLDWMVVRRLMIEKLAQTAANAHIIIYEPSGAPEPSAQVVRTDKPPMTLFVAKMMLLINRYLIEELTLSRLEIQKLAYFTHEAGDPNFASMHFAKGTYGPYSDGLSNALHRMDGHYLRGCGDNNSAFSQIELITSNIDDAEKLLKNDKDKLYLNKVFTLINGFEYPFEMELLSTVHWVASHEEKRASDVKTAIESIHAWNDHKRKTFKPEHIENAWKRLKEYGWI